MLLQFLFGLIRVENRGVRLERFHEHGNIGAGIDYDPSEQFSIRFELVFRRSVISIVDAEIRQYPYAIGANFAIYYRFPNR